MSTRQNASKHSDGPSEQDGARAAAASASQQQGSRPGVRDRRRRVLLVDNDAGVSQVVQAILDAHGYEVASVTTAEAGLEALLAPATGRPAFSLIVLDLRMPGLGGIGFLERVLQRSVPPILVLSGFVSVQDQRFLDAHPLVRGVLEKPFDLFELLGLVSELAGPTDLPGEESMTGSWD